MTSSKTICIIGTYDTKQAELAFLQQVIERDGGFVLTMDVSVLGQTPVSVDCTKHDVAAAAGFTIEEIAAWGDENRAMGAMSRGACVLARRLQAAGRFDGMIALGGTMGTDLALDVAVALPLGLPKYIISTVAFSGLIPPERIAGDVQMILWAGGLYGLNAVCRSTLSQAAGAVLGAARTATGFACTRPLVAISSLGNTVLKYMHYLLPMLEERGYEAAFFHAQGMGGRAMEALVGRGQLVAILDLCLQEVSNGFFGSPISSGRERLRAAGLAGVPQIIAPGAADLVDWPSWQELPVIFQGRACHVHNQLISSVMLDREQRCLLAREIAERLNDATGPTAVILPLRGVEEWDRQGNEAHHPEDLAAFFATFCDRIAPQIEVTKIDAHINDIHFAEAVMEIFDRFVAEGHIKVAGQPWSNNIRPHEGSDRSSGHSERVSTLVG